MPASDSAAPPSAPRFEFETVDHPSFQFDTVERWASLPDGQNFGMVVALSAHEGRIYAFQRAEPSVLVFDVDGTLIDGWGPRTDYAHGLFVNDEGVHLTDRDASTCLLYTHDGKPIQILGRRGEHSDTGTEKIGGEVVRVAGPFNGPTQMVRSPAGEIFVADGYRNARIHRFTPAGELLDSWGEFGNSEGQLWLPHSLVVTEDRVYVCDRQNDRIQVFTLDGSFLEAWTGFHLPQAIDIGTDGNLYVSDTAGAVTMDKVNPPAFVEGGMARVSVLTDAGEVLASAAIRSVGHGSCVDADGSVYAALHFGEGIDKLVRM